MTTTLMGHLGADPETRVTPNGKKVTTLRVATSVYQNGKDETIWWRVTVWGDDFKNVLDYMKKGSAVVVVGEMRSKPEAYLDKEGKPQVSLNLTAISLRFSPFGKGERSQEGGSKNGQAFQNYAAESKETSYANAFGTGSHSDSQDDEMPF